MEDKELLRKLFGKVEIETMLKKMQGKTLRQTERNYLSKSIRPKLRAISGIAGLHLLEKIHKGRERITTPDIIYNLSRYGYDLISFRKPIHEKKMALEELMVEIIINHPQPRFIEAIPMLLLKNNINQFKLLELATTYHLKNEMGYLIETAFMIKRKKELVTLLHYLQKSKEKERKILGEDLGEEYKQFLMRDSPPRIKSWNLLGRFFDHDFKTLAKGYV